LGYFIIILGFYSGAGVFLLQKDILQERDTMSKVALFLILALFSANLSGCAPLIIGAAAGGLGAYAITKDTVQGESDKSFDTLWESAMTVSRIRGVVKQDDLARGHIELVADGAYVWIDIIRLTQATTRVRIAARKYRLPNLGLAQDLYVKIVSEAK